MKIISNLREALWGVVQIKLSQLDFDYEAYAADWFARYRAARSGSAGGNSGRP